MIQNPEAIRENIDKFNYIEMDLAQCATDKSKGQTSDWKGARCSVTEEGLGSR